MQVDKNNPDLLKLDNQLCFSLYVCSREIIRAYKPILSPLGLTYTGYVVMMALWENDHIGVKELGDRIFLDSGTLTPLLKKMEKDGFVKRERSAEDERSVIISLTEKGHAVKEQCRSNPDNIICAAKLQEIDGDALMANLRKMISNFRETGV